MCELMVGCHFWHKDNTKIPHSYSNYSKITRDTDGPHHCNATFPLMVFRLLSNWFNVEFHREKRVVPFACYLDGEWAIALMLKFNILHLSLSSHLLEKWIASLLRLCESWGQVCMESNGFLLGAWYTQQECIKCISQILLFSFLQEYCFSFYDHSRTYKYRLKNFILQYLIATNSFAHMRIS